MSDDKKDFFNIAKMTETYRNFPSDSLKDDRDFRMWQVNCHLAIAQQLCVISGHLARISETLDVALDRAKKS